MARASHASAAALLLLAAALPLAPAPPAAAAGAWPNHPATGVPDGEVIVAVLDTGIFASHPEFAPGQIVAWYDFSTNGVPAPGVIWDPSTPVPFDSCPQGFCHGTGTASLVGGATLGAMPGVKLAIAKLATSSGAFTGDVGAAIRWAARDVGADVISMSFGTIIPWFGFLDDVDEALQDATDAGVLSVVSAGNGLGGLGVVPDHSSTTQPNYSPHALVVGGSGKSGTTTSRLAFPFVGFSKDPDVIAWGVNVNMAAAGTSYTTASGTSFSGPLVAGWAARAMQAAMANGKPHDPAWIERLITGTAHDDPTLPYLWEGYGFVDDGRGGLHHTVGNAVLHAALGVPPAAPSLANQAGNIEAEALRKAFSEPAGATLAVAPGTSTPGLVGASNPQLRDMDLYRVSAPIGATVAITVQWTDTAANGLQGNDLDVYAFRPAAGANLLYSNHDIRGSSAQGTIPGAPNTESFSFAAWSTGAHHVLVEGWLVEHAGQAYAITATVNGAPAPLTYQGDRLGVNPDGFHTLGIFGM